MAHLGPCRPSSNPLCSQLWEAGGALVRCPCHLLFCGSPHHCLQADTKTAPAFRAESDETENGPQSSPGEWNHDANQLSWGKLGSHPEVCTRWRGRPQAKTPLGYSACTEARGQLPDGSSGTAHLLVGTGSCYSRTESSVPFVLQLCADSSCYKPSKSI